jgi:hypothetical protein
MYESQESRDLSSESLLASARVTSDDKSSYWHAHFESWENSDLSQAEYCRRHDLKYCVFHNWKRKLRKPRQPSAPSGSGAIKFVEVGSSHPIGTSLYFRTAPVEFFRLWVGGICVEVGYKFDPQSLSQLLRCLRAL